MNSAPLRSPVIANVAPSGVGAPTAVATPSAPDRVPVHDTAAARRFAELLRQSRSDRSPPAHAPAPAPQAEASGAPVPTEDDIENGSPSARDPAAPPADAKTRAPAPTRATGKAAIDDAHAARSATAPDDEQGDDDPAVAASTSTDERAATLAALAADAAQAASGARVPHAAGDARATEAEADVDADADKGADTTGADGVGRGNARHRSGITPADAGSDPALARPAAPLEAASARGAATISQPAFGAACDQALRAVGDRPAGSTRAVAASDGVSLAFASAPIALGSAESGVAPAATLALATPIDAPDFAAALGVQVSLLAHDGVQHAELHLHPAETGPVSVHIAVDGNAARIDFGADLAATRAAIERGLPELASALREAGLTLTGGGVSQHAGSRPDAEPRPATPHGDRRGESGSAPLAGSARATRRIAAGGLDVYA